MAQIVNPPSMRNRRPGQRPFERRRVQLVIRRSDAEQIISGPTDREGLDQRQHAISHRDSTGSPLLRDHYPHALRRSALDDQQKAAVPL